jgi:hypothetical protein
MSLTPIQDSQTRMIAYVKQKRYTIKFQIDHLTSAVVFGLSLAGRWYAPKIGVTRIPFTMSALCKLMNSIFLFRCPYFLLYEH